MLVSMPYEIIMNQNCPPDGKPTIFVRCYESCQKNIMRDSQESFLKLKKKVENVC